MFELFLSVCLAADPHRCKDVSLIFSDENVTQLQCSMGIGAGAQVAKWIEAHPKWVAKRWTCRPAGQVARI